MCNFKEILVGPTYVLQQLFVYIFGESHFKSLHLTLHNGVVVPFNLQLSQLRLSKQGL